MGKTQSKRSVDITTEPKKTPEEEVTGKLEKIEDPDQKQVNGDASSQENVQSEKKDGDETENDKDLTTEKSGDEGGAQDGGGDTNTGQCNASAAESVSKEDDSTLSKDGNKTAEEISPLSDESSKKPKKEKVKKKWSFRSISFGKKDKQKPAKPEDVSNDNAAITNGDATGQTDEEASGKNQKDEASEASESKTSDEKATENGDTSEKELNGEKTPTSTTPTEEKPAKEITFNESTTNITNITTEKTNSALPEDNTTTATETNQTEKQYTNTATESSPTIVSNGDTIEKNGTETLSTGDERQDEVTVKSANLMGEAFEVAEKNKSIPQVISEVSENNGVHQNGTSASGEELETVNESKSHVEVIFQTDQAAHADDSVTLTTATTFSSPKTTPISYPDPNNTDTIENSSIHVITNFNDIHKLEHAVENPASDVVNVALKVIEPVSTSTASDIPSTEVVNVDTGSEEPSEPESDKIEKNEDRTVPESQYEDFNESSIRTNTVSTTAQDESPEPPPLPVSPPPSQVSVFAFNDNNQTEEQGEISSTTIQTDIVSESETIQLSNSEGQYNETRNMSNSQACIDEKQFNKEDAIFDSPSSTSDIASLNPAESIKNESNTETIDTKIVENGENYEAPKGEESNSYKETANSATISNYSNSIDENTEIELVKEATAVVDEISEKAVELIQQQLQQTEIKSTDDDNITTNNVYKTDNKSIELNNHINDDIKSNETSIHEEVTNEMESLNTNYEDKSCVKNVAPLDVESELIDCIKMTDKLIVEGEEETIITTDICSQSVVSVTENQN